jgi:PAS domain S-box-containing protein
MSHSILSEITHSFFSETEDLVFIVETENFQILEVNKAVMDKLSLCFERLLLTPFLDFFPEDQRQKVEAKARAVTGAQPTYLNSTMVTKDGTELLVEINWSRARWGQTDILFIVARDTTDAVAARNACHALFDQISVPSVIIDTNGEISYVNSEFCLLSGYARQEIQDKKKWTEFIPPENLPLIDNNPRKKQNTPEIYRSHLLTRHGKTKEPQDIKIIFIPGTQKRIVSITNASSKRLPKNVKPLIYKHIIGESRAMKRVYEQIAMAAESDSSIIIYGESGTGKELVARAIHMNSHRSRNHFVPVNCGAIPEGVSESEFFGYKKGAFSGANCDKPGYLDMADKGTLFLDEIGEISINLQVKLLRAIEGQGYMPVGGRRLSKPDVRIIAATNRNLKEAMEQEKIRPDFFYRIHIFPIYLPPLRKRMEDLPLLIDYFLKKYQDEDKPKAVSQNVFDLLSSYNWPGNIRELQNVVRRYVVFDEVYLDGRRTNIAPTPPGLTIEGPGAESIETPGLFSGPLQEAVSNFEREYLRITLEKQNWNRTNTAADLGIDRKTLFRKIKAYNLCPRPGQECPTAGQ